METTPRVADVGDAHVDDKMENAEPSDEEIEAGNAIDGTDKVEQEEEDDKAGNAIDGTDEVVQDDEEVEAGNAIDRNDEVEQDDQEDEASNATDETDELERDDDEVEIGSATVIEMARHRYYAERYPDTSFLRHMTVADFLLSDNPGYSRRERRSIRRVYDHFLTGEVSDLVPMPSLNGPPQRLRVIKDITDAVPESLNSEVDGLNDQKSYSSAMASSTSIAEDIHSRHLESSGMEVVNPDTVNLDTGKTDPNPTACDGAVSVKRENNRGPDNLDGIPMAGNLAMNGFIDIPSGFLERLNLEVVDLHPGKPETDNKAGRDEPVVKDESVEENGIAGTHASVPTHVDTDGASDEEKPEEPPSLEYFLNLAKPTPEQIALTSLKVPPPPAPAKTLFFGPPRAPYQFKITLLPTQNQTVARIISVPAELPFSTFHHAIQMAFNWSNLHSYFFNLLKLPGGTPVQDVLDGVGFVAKDQYWCRFDGVPEISEEKVVKVLDSKDAKLYQVFERWADWSVESGVRAEGKEEEETPVVEYEYDLVLGWVHRIELIGRGDGGAGYNRIFCLSGEGHSAAEDLEAGFPVSGEWDKLKAVYRLLDGAKADAADGVVYEKKLLSSDQQSLKFWYERDCMNGDRHGLGEGRVDLWDRVGVNNKLAKIEIQGLGYVVIGDAKIAEVVEKEVKPLCCASLNDYGDDRRRDDEKGLTEVEDWETSAGCKEA